MRIKRVSLNSWRQYGEIDINFHPNLTILAGENGTGKTTILNLINSHFGWSISWVTAPPDMQQRDSISAEESEQMQTTYYEVGEFGYGNGETAPIMIPQTQGSIFNVKIAPPEKILGLHIPSHRPVYTYKAITEVPIRAISKKDAYQKYHKAVKERYLGAHMENSEMQIIKQTLISAAILGHGNEVVSEVSTANLLWEDFQEILRIVLPEELGFECLLIKVPEVIMKTKSGEFPIDAVSGGIAAIIDIVWQIYTFDAKEPFVVTMDEPENHLHPLMQKMLLPKLIKAFPLAQFIVATHNPMIITSSPDSSVYLLKRNEAHKIDSVYLEGLDKAASPEEILHHALGIESMIPAWVDDKILEMINRYEYNNISPDKISAFKEELKDSGLGKYVAVSLAKWINKKQISNQAETH